MFRKSTLAVSLWGLIRLYAAYVAAFVLGKPLFVLLNLREGVGLADVARAVWHGLPMDLSTAGYFMLLPLLLVVAASLFPVGRKALRAVLTVHLALTALLAAVALVVDAVMYRFWDFKLDATVLNYIDSPRDALASVSMWFVLLGLLGLAAVAVAVFLLTRWAARPLWGDALRPASWPGRALQGLATLLLGGAIFILVRGGLSESTMNVGRAYFSDRQFLNHTAVNPLFSFGSSALKNQDYGSLYRYMDDAEADALVDSLLQPLDSPADTLLRDGRPNVLLVILEGFSAAFVGELGGLPGVAPNLDRLCREGVSFDSCFANSFRTDRGVVSVLGGYPAFPDFSVMKIPQKSRHLPTLASALRDAGYATSFLYGGDINFTNMNSYLLAGGFQSVMGSGHFPADARQTHAWGAQDHIVLDTLANQVLRLDAAGKPFFAACLTLSSHEPWQVPFDRLADDRVANTMAYTDSCLGVLIDRLRQSPVWDNLVVALVADHGIIYPAGVTEADPAKHHIPLVLTGGAVARPRRVATLCTQSDLAATLLAALRLPADGFPFSRDIMRVAHPFAFHTFAGGLEWIDPSGVTVVDLNARRVLADDPEPSAERQRRGKAFLQRAARHFNQLR